MVKLKERQQKWIDLLLKEIETHPMGITQDMFLSRNTDKDLPIPKSWVKAEHWDWEYPCDFRSILWNEIVFDIDAHTWFDVYNNAYKIIYTLKKLNAPYYLYPSSGKGLHISVFLDVDGKQNETDWLDIRMGIFNYVRSLSFVPEFKLNKDSWKSARMATFHYLNNNGIFSDFNVLLDKLSFSSDISRIRWSDETQGSLIRCEGGGRYRKELSIDGEENYVKIYKGLVYTLPTKRIEITEPWDVSFPTHIVDWKVPKEILQFIKSHDKQKYEIREQHIDNFSGYVSPCVQNLIKRAIDGENLSHNERFIIVSYLWKRGWTKSEIHNIFLNVPDYVEHTTNYMINDITGKRYKPMSCKSMQFLGLCSRECKWNKKMNNV